MSSKYYLLKKVLKKNDAGMTTLVESLIDGQLLVMKKIYLLSDKDKESAIREAQILSALPPHDHIVAIKRWFIEADSLYLIMEACDCDLTDWIINNNTQSASEKREQIATEIALQIGKALDHIHSNGIIHRDIKPRNILVVDSGDKKLLFKLSDFGIARKLGKNLLAETAIGTPYYLSPEICTGQPYDFKTDMWSLGCVIYEVYYGTRPFNSYASTIKDLINQILCSKVRVQSTSNLIDFVILKLLEREPLKRPNAAQLLKLIFDKKIPSPDDFESEYKALCQIAGKDRLDKFISLISSKSKSGVLDGYNNFASQLQPINLAASCSTSQLLGQIFALRKQVGIPEEDLDTVLEIMRSHTNQTGWESKIIEAIGNRRHQCYIEKRVYNICYQLFVLEKKAFESNQL